MCGVVRAQMIPQMSRRSPEVSLTLRLLPTLLARRAMQTAIHTQQGGSYGSGNCDRNGCFARTGGPNSPRDLQHSYGPNQRINSLKPFDVETRVDNGGSLTIQLHQDGKTVTTFDRQMAGAHVIFTVCPQPVCTRSHGA